MLLKGCSPYIVRLGQSLKGSMGSELVSISQSSSLSSNLLYSLPLDLVPWRRSNATSIFVLFTRLQLGHQGQVFPIFRSPLSLLLKIPSKTTTLSLKSYSDFAKKTWDQREPNPRRGHSLPSGALATEPLVHTMLSALRER